MPAATIWMMAPEGRRATISITARHTTITPIAGI
jgi:hypothetical protein